MGMVSHYARQFSRTKTSAPGESQKQALRASHTLDHPGSVMSSQSVNFIRNCPGSMLTPAKQLFSACTAMYRCTRSSSVTSCMDHPSTSQQSKHNAQTVLHILWDNRMGLYSVFLRYREKRSVSHHSFCNKLQEILAKLTSLQETRQWLSFSWTCL